MANAWEIYKKQNKSKTAVIARHCGKFPRIAKTNGRTSHS